MLKVLISCVVLSFLVCAPYAAAQTSARTPATPDVVGPIGYVGPNYATYWLFYAGFEYCVPGDCMDLAVGQNVSAETVFYGTCVNGLKLSAGEFIVAENCSAPVYLETTGMQKTTLKYFNGKHYGMDGGQANAQASDGNGVVIAAGFYLSWCDGSFSSEDFPAPC